MTTIPTKVQEIVERSVFIKDAISKGLLNLSAYSREIKPKIEQSLMKSASEASILMALKRYSESIHYEDLKLPDFSKHYGEISLRSGLFEITYTNSKTLYSKISELYKMIPENAYLTFIKGVWQTTLIASLDIKDEIIGALKNEEIETEWSKLSSMTIKLKAGHIEQPGIISHVLQILSWEGINIIEVVSTWDELTIILQNSQVELAFKTIQGKIIGK
ncbi:MAG: hypothetical protein Q9M91_05535 [Candidatus Dojkabacteria bacterium]|nr:hypothetical protein [Candidatus Dojkabacteria bacterium]MDQ7021265.1 hypothetical protein [Candidatus Dojkabacteria bacterium]